MLETTEQLEKTLPPNLNTNNDFIVPTIGQLGLLRLQARSPNSTAFNESLVLRGAGDVDSQSLKITLSKTILRHQTLCTNFSQQLDKFIVQDVSHCDIEWREENISADIDYKTVIDTWITTPLLFSERLPLRAGVIRTSNNIFYVVLIVHHAVIDGWSFGLLIKEWNQLICNSTLIQSTPTLNQQNEIEKSWLNKHGEDAKVWWKAHLTNAPAISLPEPDHYRKTTNKTQKIYKSCLKPKRWQQLTQISRQHGCSEFILLQVLLSTTLCRLYDLQQVVIASPCAARSQKESYEIIGFFANTLPFHLKYDPNKTIAEALKAQRTETFQAFNYQQLPYETILEQCSVKAIENLSLLSQVFLVVQNHSITNVELGQHDLTLCHDTHIRTPKAELILECIPNKNSVLLQWRYVSHLFNRSTIERLDVTLNTLLQSILEKPHLPLGSLPLIDNIQQATLSAFNATDIQLPKYSLPIQISKLSETHDIHPAIIDGLGKAWSYGELEISSNRISSHLYHLGIKAGDIVGVCAQRSAELIIAVLGIMKSGAAYLAIDPDYPENRVKFMLEDGGAVAVITDGTHSSVMKSFHPIPITEAIESINDWQLPINNTLSETAYINFTSGSSGKPKACLLTHIGLANFALGARQVIPFDKDSRLLQFSSPGFDAFTAEWVMSLSNGSTLILPLHDKAKDIDYLSALIAQQRVTHLHLPPTVLTQLDPKVLTSVSHVISIGEALSDQVISRWYTHTHIYNGYGPSEFTIASHYHKVTSDLPAATIGKPLANTRCYIVDSNLELLPFGAVGELCLAGAGISSGYLNLPELTKSKFITAPTNWSESGKVYRTGDLARWTKNGELIYLGRHDNQVKLRGVRIETDEINRLLCHHGMFSDAVTFITKTPVGDALYSAVVSNTSSHTQTPDALRAMLATHLPSNMMPAQILVLTSLPRTPNNKVDYSALTQQIKNQKKVHEAPENEIEAQITQLFSELLKHQVGVTSDFFVAGGHSLLAARLISKVTNKLDVNIQLSDFYANSSPRTLAVIIAEKQKSLTTSKPECSGKERPHLYNQQVIKSPLTPAQEQFWLIDKFGHSEGFNITECFELIGNLNIDAFKFAFNSVINRHDALSSCFPAFAGEPYQTRRKEFYQNGHIGTFQYSSIQVDQQEYVIKQALATGFNLETGPLVRGYLWQVNNNKYIFMLIGHHIVLDGWSLQNFSLEISELYQGYHLKGTAFKLPPLSLNYFDYATRLAVENKQTEVTNLIYWKNILSNTSHKLSLPTDSIRNSQSPRIGRHRTTFTQLQAEELKQLCISNRCSLFVSLYSALSIQICHMTNHKEMLLGTTIATRDSEDLESLIGLFLNTHILRCSYNPEQSFSVHIKANQKQFFNGLLHKHFSFEKLLHELQVQPNNQAHPLFQVMMVMQNTESHPFTLPGIEITRQNIPPEPNLLDIYLSVSENDSGEIVLDWQYNANLFRHETIHHIADKLMHFTLCACRDADRPLNNLISYQGNVDDVYPIHATPPFNPENSAITLWNNRTLRQSDSIAVIDNEGVLSTFDVEQLANEISEGLVLQGICSGDRIGLSLSRGRHMAICILACMKIGAAYVPLDPTYPTSRLHNMESDAELSLIIDNQTDAIEWHTPTITTQQLVLNTRKTKTRSPSNNILSVDPDSSAYVIFTSGSTGRPKMVSISHQNLAHYLYGAQKHYQISATDRLLQIASFSFDTSVEEHFMSLCFGAALVYCHQQNFTGLNSFVEVIEKHRINVVSLPTALWHEYCYSLSHDTHLAARLSAQLRLVIIGGEAVQKSCLEKWQNAIGTDVQLLNTYGPTETTVIATIADLTHDKNAVIPIGSPIAGTPIKIIDKYGRDCRCGQEGELWIGGNAVSSGYSNAPEQAQHVFLHLPCDTRYYRTGDRVSWNESGVLFYHGRLDTQIKHHGFRIETVEIEEIARHCTGIKDAVVAQQYRGDNQIFLVIWLCRDITDDTDKTELINRCRIHIKQQLPAYMHPDLWELMDTFPHTLNGKLDRAAIIQTTTLSPLTDGDTNTTSLSDTKNLLTLWWQQALGLKTIPTEGDFFNLGGNSLHLTRILGNIYQYYGIRISYWQFAAKPTIAGLLTLLPQQSSSNGMADHNNEFSIETITFRKSQSNLNIICFPGIIGQSESFAHLVKSITIDATIIGLNAPITSSYISFDEAVSHYADLFDKYGSTSLLFIGHSLGGCLAVATATMLKQRGIKEPAVIIMDSWPGCQPKLSQQDAFEKFHQIIAQTLSVPYQPLPINISSHLRCEVLAEHLSKTKNHHFSEQQLNHMFQRYMLQSSYYYQPPKLGIQQLALIDLKEAQTPRNLWLSASQSPLLSCAVAGQHYTMLSESCAPETARAVSYLISLLVPSLPVKKEAQ